MLAIPSNCYALWRARALVPPAFREGEPAALLNERLLQAIWLHQRIRREELTAVDGQPIRVLHPGFWNHEPGPDFREAIIQFGSAPPVIGDIEIDLHPRGWRGHGHDTNPSYRKVILHVVWESDGKPGPPLPTLVLQNLLDSPLNELHGQLVHASGDKVATMLEGQCCAPLRGLPTQTWMEILRQAAQVRLQAKAAQFQARARQAGWEQALWEGLFGALGYKHNVWPMRRLAELIPIQCPSPAEPVRDVQARLLGLSGLLPSELPRAQGAASEYVRGVWDVWWRERARLEDRVLPRAAWRLGGLRPANHPQRRLALAAHWLHSGDLPARLERWFAAAVPDDELLPSLLEVLQARRDAFWSWHWTLNSKRRKTSQPLLGPQRVTDLAINSILPWFWTRAAAGRSETLRATAEHRYFAWPKAEDNSVLRLARQRLFATTPVREIKTAAAQQGLLQIVRDFCQRSNALCERCPFPELVKSVTP